MVCPDEGRVDPILAPSFREMLLRFNRGSDDFEETCRRGRSMCVEWARERLAAGVTGREVSVGPRQSRGILDGKATKSLSGTTSL